MHIQLQAYHRGALVKFELGGPCLVLKIQLFNANNSSHLNRVKLNCSGFSHLQYNLKRLLQAYFRFQDISLCQAWATYGPQDHFMRPAGASRNITPTVNQAEDLFFALPTSAALILAVVYDIKYDSSNNPTGQRQGLHYPTYSPPTRKFSHP